MEMLSQDRTVSSVYPSATADGCPPVVSSDKIEWFVMRVTYCREMKARLLFQSAGVECYVPMRCERDDQGKHFVPAIHNLIFVHTSRKFMDSFKCGTEAGCPLRYMMDRNTRLPIVVRDKEMEDFMRVMSSREDGVMYLDDPKAVIAKGIPVEIVAGQFKGVRGRLLRVRRNRKVVLQLAGVVAAAVDGIPIESCRVIQDADEVK